MGIAKFMDGKVKNLSLGFLFDYVVARVMRRA